MKQTCPFKLETGFVLFPRRIYDVRCVPLTSGIPVPVVSGGFINSQTARFTIVFNYQFIDDEHFRFEITNLTTNEKINLSYKQTTIGYYYVGSLVSGTPYRIRVFPVVNGVEYSYGELNF
ncbi:MAG: hypothetical protein EBS86_07750 [Crocinitomicaceae bacterium]|nr:hypothetical protein [Crocinitomicaceae bacterium]